MEKLLIRAATNNKHKLVEFKEIFSQAAEADTEVMALGEAVKLFAGEKANYGDPEETGETFAANAFIKASSSTKNACKSFFKYGFCKLLIYDFNSLNISSMSFLVIGR